MTQSMIHQDERRGALLQSHNKSAASGHESSVDPCTMSSSEDTPSSVSQRGSPEPSTGCTSRNGVDAATEWIDRLFSMENLRHDRELLNHMNGRMMLPLQDLQHHSGFCEGLFHMDDVLSAARASKRVFLEELFGGVHYVGPAAQSGPKSRCTIMLQSTTSVSVSDTIPDVEAAQRIVGDARILHFYLDCNALLLTFEDDNAAKSALFTSNQNRTTRKLDISCKLRIDNNAHAAAGHGRDHGRRPGATVSGPSGASSGTPSHMMGLPLPSQHAHVPPVMVPPVPVPMPPLGMPPLPLPLMMMQLMAMRMPLLPPQLPVAMHGPNKAPVPIHKALPSASNPATTLPKGGPASTAPPLTSTAAARSQGPTVTVGGVPTTATVPVHLDASQSTAPPSVSAERVHGITGTGVTSSSSATPQAATPQAAVVTKAPLRINLPVAASPSATHRNALGPATATASQAATAPAPPLSTSMAPVDSRPLEVVLPPVPATPIAAGNVRHEVEVPRVDAATSLPTPGQGHSHHLHAEDRRSASPTVVEDPSTSRGFAKESPEATSTSGLATPATTASDSTPTDAVANVLWGGLHVSKIQEWSPSRQWHSALAADGSNADGSSAAASASLWMQPTNATAPPSTATAPSGCMRRQESTSFVSSASPLTPMSTSTPTCGKYRIDPYSRAGYVPVATPAVVTSPVTAAVPNIPVPLVADPPAIHSSFRALTVADPLPARTQVEAASQRNDRGEPIAIDDIVVDRCTYPPYPPYPHPTTTSVQQPSPRQDDATPVEVPLSAATSNAKPQPKLSYASILKSGSSSQ